MLARGPRQHDGNVDALRPITAGAEGDDAPRLGFSASFGIPRWRAPQRTQEAAPAPIMRALMARQAKVFDTACEGFPRPATHGRGIALLIPAGEAPLGVLVMIDERERPVFPSDVQVAETAAFYIGLLLEQQCVIDALRACLAQVRQLSSVAPEPDGAASWAK